ncbi:MAG: hypothetical protein ACFFCP_17260 [Promethearchaeota archaeon]
MINRRRRWSIAIVAIVIVAVGVSVVFLYRERWSSSNLSWDVQIGDEFIYELESIYRYSDSNFNATVFTRMSALNHTQVRMEIVLLPDIPPLLDDDILAAEIINIVKTHCTFDNGSELPVYYSDEINQLLSACLLPTGDWDLLDRCFMNEVSNAFYPGAYTSELQVDHFNIGYEVWPGDATIRWSANVTLENGVPLEIFSENNSFSVGTYTSFQLTIRL